MLVKMIGLGIGGVCFFIVIFLVVVTACCCCRKQKPDHWKHGCLVRWLCGGWLSEEQVAAAEHQRQRHGSSGLSDIDLCPHEAIPLRSSNVIDNPTYLSQTETPISTAGD